MEAARADDPYRIERAAVFVEWHKVMGGNDLLVREVIATASSYPDLFVALIAVAAHKNGKEISPERLGRWLARNRGAIVSNLTLVRSAVITGGFPLWKIEQR
jgi:hypothetical protein